MKKISYGPQINFSIFEESMVEMTWQEVDAAVKRNAIILLPVGIVEAHGPHMDLSPDFYISAIYCRFLKQELAELGIEALIAPNVYWGIGNDTAKYAGTFSVSPETFKGLLKDILKSLHSWGFKNVFIFNAHGDPVHLATIQTAIKETHSLSDFQAYFLLDLDVSVDSDLQFPEMREDSYQPDYHAGAVETSQMNAFFPEKIKRDIALSLSPQNCFDPLAYCGDPASYEREINVAEICSIDVKLDALKIQKLLCDIKQN